MLELRNQVLVGPNLTLEKENLNPNYFHCKITKRREKILLGLIHWYFPDEIRVLVNLFLEQSWGKEDLALKALLLSSKTLALGCILEQEIFSDRDFFGNLLKKSTLKNFLLYTSVKFKGNKGRVIYPEFRRGYKDKGSKPPEHQPERIFFMKNFRTPEEELQKEVRLQLEYEVLLSKVLTRLSKEGIA